MKKKIIIVIFMICLVCGLATVDTAQADTNELVIVLDPGHDSKHGGAGGNGLREEELNLKIAKYCYEELSEYNGVKVYMTHDTLSCPYPGKNSRDDNISRIRYAKSVNADVVVSLHNNSNKDSSVRGATIYYPNTSYHYDHHTTGKGLAQSIINQLAALGIYNRGIEYKNSQDNTRYPDGSLADYYRVINEGKLQDVPTIIVEHVFISNASDAQTFLSSDEKLKALGIADATGIAKYFGLSKVDYSPIFDAHYYSETYPDLKKAYGSNEKALLNHFINYGMKEGRNGNSTFNVYSYRGRYSDLQNAYGDNLKKYYEHYLYWGQAEGRDGSAIGQVFQVRFMQGEEVISTQNVVFGQDASTKNLTKSGATLKLDKSVSCITSDMDVQVSYAYIYNGVDYTSVFDAEYYLSLYPDLRQAYGTDGDKALHHFLNWGMNEGRCGKSTFDVYSYRGRYADLQQVYKMNLKDYYKHYINWGFKEHRDATPVNENFTVQFIQGERVINTQTVAFGHCATTKALERSGATLKLTKDISCITTDMDVQVSYAYIYNGVDYSPVFDAEYYLSLYPDLRQAYGTDGTKALNHFIKWGMNEGRVASENFNVHTYKSRYRDLQNAYGNNLKAYFTHYLNWGIKEGRSGR